MGTVSTRTRDNVTSSHQGLEATLLFSHSCHALGPYGKGRMESSDWLTHPRSWVIIDYVLFIVAESGCLWEDARDGEWSAGPRSTPSSIFSKTWFLFSCSFIV